MLEEELHMNRSSCSKVEVLVCWGLVRRRCSSNHWSRSHWADTRSLSHRLEQTELFVHSVEMGQVQEVEEVACW